MVYHIEKGFSHSDLGVHVTYKISSSIHGRIQVMVGCTHPVAGGLDKDSQSLH